MAVSYLYFERVTITNNQPVATPGVSFQQLFSFDARPYAGWAAKADLGNVRFYYDQAFTKKIDSWLESGTNATVSASFWLLINPLAAFGAITVYMVFLSPISTPFDGVQAGQAPQLSASYALYDNGTTIFPTFYDNFNGSSLSAAWNTTGFNVGDVVVNNGVVINTYDIPTEVMTLKAQKTGPLVVESLVKTNDELNGAIGTDFSSEQSNDNNTRNGGGYATIYAAVVGPPKMFEGIVPAIQAFGPTVNIGYGLPIPTPGLVNVTTFQVVSFAMDKNSLYLYQNYSLLVTGPPTSPSITLYPGIHTAGDISTVRNTVQWFRIRQNPPNGVMPGAVISRSKLMSGNTSPRDPGDVIEDGERRFIISAPSS